MKQRLSRLAQIREDLNFALAMLVLGFAIGAFSFIPNSNTASSQSQTRTVSTTQ